MALALAARGFDVAVHYASSRSGADETVLGIQELGQRGAALQADLTDQAATQALFPAARAALGGDITCLINNASIFEYDTVETASRESWDRHMESNLRAPFVLTQHMAAQNLAPLQDDRGEPMASGLIINGTADRVAPPADTQTLVVKLHEQKGITITHQELEGSDHFFKEPHMDTMIGNVKEYVARRLTENTR